MRTPTHLLPTLVDTASGTATPWAAAILGRNYDPVFPHQWIAVRAFLGPMPEGDHNRQAPAGARWVQPPLVEAITEVAEELATAAPQPAADLMTGTRLFQELLANAVGHRDWTPATLTVPVLVDRFPNGVRITSPGPLPDGVRLQRGRPEGQSTHNVGAMSLLCAHDLARQHGAGVRTAIRLAGDLGYEIRWRHGRNTVTCELTVAVQPDVPAPAAPATRASQTVLADRIVTLLKNFGDASTSELVKRLGAPNSTVRAALRRLVVQGVIHQRAAAPRSPDQRYTLV